MYKKVTFTLTVVQTHFVFCTMYSFLRGELLDLFNIPYPPDREYYYLSHYDDRH